MKNVVFGLLAIVLWLFLFPISVNLVSGFLSGYELNVCSLGICVDNTFLRMMLIFVWIFVPMVAIIYMFRGG